MCVVVVSSQGGEGNEHTKTIEARAILMGGPAQRRAEYSHRSLRTKQHKEAEDKMTIDQQIDQIAELAAQLPDAIRERFAALETLEKEIEILERTSCTGVEYWRDRNNAPKLYINHGVDQACPVHGLPDPGKRIRAYVGVDPDKQAAALAAIENCARLEQARKQQYQLTITLNTLDRRIKNLYDSIGYLINGNNVCPDPDWTPGGW